MTNCPYCNAPISKSSPSLDSKRGICTFDCGYATDSPQPYECRIRELECRIQRQNKTIMSLYSQIDDHARSAVAQTNREVHESNPPYMD